MKDLEHIHVVMPTLRGPQSEEAIESLNHIPYPHTLILSDVPGGWAKAVNHGIKQVHDDEHPILIMDDDVVITEETFNNFDRYWHAADVFGFKLLFPKDGSIQHAGGHVSIAGAGHYGRGFNPKLFTKPRYVSHCTASLLLVKRHIFDEVGLMDEDFPGVQFEDVDFSLRVIELGWDILYVPNIAFHHESATKMDKEMVVKMAISWDYLQDKWKGSAVWDMVGRYPYELD